MKRIGLGELCSPKQWGVLPKSEMTEHGFPVYGANGVIGYSPEYTHEEATILVGCRGTIGAVHICSPKSFATGNTMALDSLRTDLVDMRYLARFLRWRGLSDVTSGSSQPQLTRSNLVKVEVPVPPLDEQRRIAAILDQADAVRVKRRNILELVDTIPQSIFVEMFGDPIRNPFGLPIVPLGQLGELDRGVSRHRPRNDPALLGGPYPLIQTGDVARSGGLITRYSTTYSELGLAQSKLWPAGTLCITIAANIAQTGVLNFDACFPDSVVGFTADQATTTYVRVWLNFLQPTLEASAPQSAQRNINLAILRGLPVPLPEPGEIQRFDRLIDQVRKHQRINQDALVQDGHLLTSVQSRAFAGQL